MQMAIQLLWIKYNTDGYCAIPVDAPLQERAAVAEELRIERRVLGHLVRVRVGVGFRVRNGVGVRTRVGVWGMVRVRVRVRVLGHRHCRIVVRVEVTELQPALARPRASAEAAGPHGERVASG